MNMLRLESYLSPFLLSYLSKYIKDIEPQNFNLSLWGGDAVLHNVCFKLDALDSDLGGAPFSFVSCQAQELQLHVPWSKLASEAVIVTLNNVECVVKLDCCKPKKRSPKEEPTAESEVQPSYIDNLMKKIKNNVNLIINNLIIKYVEDDIILSVNIHKFDYHGADENWSQTFVDMSENSPVLRHVLLMKDITVCLDKRETSGRVENYEDPMVFRMTVEMRQHTTYPSHTARKPIATKYNLMVERYELTIGENQLPAFLRLLQLCLNIYYGAILITRTESEPNTEQENVSDNQQGWASWAWSYVPAISQYDDSDSLIVKNSIISFGLYVKNIVIKFKVATSDVTGSVRRTMHSKQPLLLKVNAQGFSLEIVAKGLEFFSCDTIICNGSIYCSKKFPPSVVSGGIDSINDVEVLVGFSKGSMVGFAANSLFDFRSPENNNAAFDYALSKDSYFQRNLVDSNKAFIALYLYIAADGRNIEIAEEEDFCDVLKYVELTDITQWNAVRERSWKKFTIGGEQSELLFGSHLLCCVDILKKWADNHNFKSYPLKPRSHINRPEKLDEIKILHFIPSRSASIDVQNVNITFPALHIQANKESKTFTRIDLLTQSTATQSHVHRNAQSAKLPCLTLKIDHATFTMRQPMYARHLAAYLSLFRSPPSKLMQMCNTSYSVDLNAIDVSMASVSVEPTVESEFEFGGDCVCKTGQILLESFVLQATEYWEDRATMLRNQGKLKIQQMAVSTTPNQAEMALHILDSWSCFFQTSKNATEVLDVCFLEHIFHTKSQEKFFIDVGCILADCNQTFASTSVLSSVKYLSVFCQNQLQTRSAIVSCTGKQFFTKKNNESDEMVNWLSMYFQLPNSNQTGGCFLVNAQGIEISLDNFLLDILAQMPSITPKQMLPVSMAASVKAPQSQKPMLSNFRSWNYVVQFHCDGVKVQFPSSSKPMESPPVPGHYQPLGQGLCIIFPKTTVFTSGHKTVSITPNLLTTGVGVNKYTEFGTFSMAMEKAEVFTVLDSSESISFHHIANAYSATCRLVVSPPKTDEGLSNVSIHLDVEPIEVKISRPQVELCVEIIIKVLSSLISIQTNCMTPVLYSTQAIPDVTVSNASDTQGHNQLRDDSKSNLSALVVKQKISDVKCTVWLQCTLSRFSFSVYNAHQSKTVLCVEDVSLSLDYQNVYLKLMSCCSSCVVAHFLKKNDQWQDAHATGMSLTPMFSKYPIFIHDYPVKKRNASQEQKDLPTHRKFVDITFTQALTTDYKRHLIEDSQESIEVPNTGEEDETQTRLLKVCVSELICAIQPFDIMVNPGILADILPVFHPVLKIFDKGQSMSVPKKSTGLFDVPVIYFALAGVRMFFPCASETELVKGDDMLLLFLNKVEVNPHPLNPLARLVLAPSLYNKASVSGLLHSVGSALEDKQFEITFQDFSVGTTRRTDVVVYLEKPVPKENPALQWNLNSENVFKDPMFHPILQEFDFQMTFAPPIWYHNKSKKWILVCGPSVEACFSSDVTLHVTKMQLNVVDMLVGGWSQSYAKHLSFSKAKQKAQKIVHNDSGFSMTESFRSKEKPTSKNPWLVGDGLFAAQNITVLYYQFSSSGQGQPLCHIHICEPSLVVHVSQLKQKLELQLHDLSISLAKVQQDQVASVHAKSTYSVKVFMTLPGDTNRRTGVPSSLFTLNVQHFLSKNAVVKASIGRPIKFLLEENACKLLKIFFGHGNVGDHPPAHVNKPSTNLDSKLFSCLSMESNQIVVEVMCDDDSACCSVSEIAVNTEYKHQNIGTDIQLLNLAAHVKSTETNFLPLMSPVTVQGKVNIEQVPKQLFIYKASLSVSKINVSLSKNIHSSLLNIYQQAMLWHRSIFGRHSSSDHEYIKTTVQDVSYSNSDDLRTGSYTYIVAKDEEPTANQIVFSDGPDLSSMTWCYETPLAIRHVRITPVPFTSTYTGNLLPCKLEYFDTLRQKYQEVKRLELSESNEVEFDLFDDFTPFQEVVSSVKWRISFSNTESCMLSVMTLAAAMQVESVYNPKFVPTVTLQLDMEGCNLTYLASDIECLRMKIKNAKTCVRMWNHVQHALGFVDSALNFCLDVMDLSNLTWLPVFLPQNYVFNLKKDTESFDISCFTENEVVEFHISQKILCTLCSLQAHFDASAECRHPINSCIKLHNHTVKNILCGQALTDECINLSPNETHAYIWRSQKMDPKLHLSLDMLPDWIWSESFPLNLVEPHSSVVDPSNTVVITMESNGPFKSISLHGCTKFDNRLPINVQCQVMFSNEVKEDYILTSNKPSEFLWSLGNVTTVFFQFEEVSFGPKKLVLSDLIHTNGKTVPISFPDEKKEMIYCQVCYHKEKLVDNILIMPHFVVRSHLPKPAYLHVETRSKHMSLVVDLQSRGSELQLLHLSPYTTHHLTVQVNQNSSPFDSKIPIHGSLVYTMDETHDFSKPLCTLEKYFPYNKASYKEEASDLWSPGDGSIHANLSLYCNALLVEITPWCLIVNETTETLCVVSPDNATSIIQPGLTEVPHYFMQAFRIKLGNSMWSRKLHLTDVAAVDHPARQKNHKPGEMLPDSIHNIFLKKDNFIYDVTINSCVRHGIRVITVTPTYWFINNSLNISKMRIKGCTNQDKQMLKSSTDFVDASSKDVISILAWQVETSSPADVAEITYEAPLMSSAEETSSSFICIENSNAEPNLASCFTDRSICFLFSENSAVVSVKDAFVKRNIVFRNSDTDELTQSCILTQHSEDDHLFLVLSDTTSFRYQVSNNTDSNLQFREITDETSETITYKLPSSHTVHFDSYMDVESFPRCRRIYRSIKLQFALHDASKWGDALIPNMEYAEEFLIPDVGITPITVRRKHNCVLITLGAVMKENHQSRADSDVFLKSYNFKLNMKEAKLVMIDDETNMLLRTDVVHVCLSDFQITMLSDPLSKSWDVVMSLGNFQLDNKLFLTPDFPVFFWSCPTYSPTNLTTAFLCNVSLTKDFQFDSMDVSLGAVQLKLEGSFAQVLSQLLQSYLSSAKVYDTQKTEDSSISDALRHEISAASNPIRFSSLTVQPFLLLLSVRADVQLYLSVDRGAISFSKFVCCDVDSTINEIIQEMSRHYFADAVFGAGWLLGSLDILGNPATTLRSFAQGITDLVVLPYQGLTRGPTAFIGGFAYGVSSLLKHFSSGTLRSITNIATGISRNFDSQGSQSSLVLQLPQAYKDKNKDELQSDHRQPSYVSGIGKAIVKVVTKPIGGAAGIVSKAGESILRKTGLEVYMMPRYNVSLKQVNDLPNSLSKLSKKVVSQEESFPIVAVLPVQMVSSVGVDFQAELFLSKTNLYILRSEDDKLENTLPVDEIDVFLRHKNNPEESEHCILVIQHLLSVPTETISVYKEKVAEYLGVGGQMEAGAGTESKDTVKFTAKVDSRMEANFFCNVFNNIKPKDNRFPW